MIIQTEKLILIEYEANYGLRHIYLDGRELPPQGEPQPFWYGYSVGHWDGDDLVVETNNLRGADEDSPYDGWMDVNGSPYTRQAKFTERFRRPTFGHLQIDLTIEDPKAYTKPWTVRIDQRLLPDQELIEFVCNENQQFGSRIKLTRSPQVNHQAHANSSHRGIRGVMKIGALTSIAAAAVAASLPLAAHHSFSAEFDASKEIKATGAVTQTGLAEPAWLDSPDRDRDLRAHRRRSRP